MTIYGWPSSKADVLGTLSRSTVSVLGYDKEKNYTLIWNSEHGYGYIRGNHTSSGKGDTLAKCGLYRIYRTEYLTVRKSASTDGEKLGKLYTGDIVIVKTEDHNGGFSDGFAKIDFDGKTGYVLPSYLEHVSGGEVVPGSSTVQYLTTGETVYGWQSASADAFGALSGKTVWIMGYDKEKDYTLILSDKYNYGYLKGKYSLN